ncbi:MAG: oxalate:formate antiporter, partial [Candidatus Melainabacteria bacterium HGW-Melainabacteria-1]
MTLPIHQQFATRAIRFVETDERFAGLTVGGSWREGRLDEWSDLDLVLVAWPEQQAAILDSRMEIAHALGELLSGFTGEHIGDPRVLICLYDNPLLHVDLKFVSLPDFEVRVEDPVVLFERDNALSEILSRTTGAYPLPDLQWIEDRFWVWTHYAGLRLGRGELMELADHLSYVRNSVLGSLLLMKHGLPP